MIQKRANVIFYDEGECDSCDKVGEIAHISLGITHFVWNICKECLCEYVNGFYTEQELRKIKLKQINGIF